MQILQQKEETPNEEEKNPSQIIPEWSIIAKSLHDGFAIIDEDTNIVFANNSLAKMLGVTVDRLLEMQILDIMTEESKFLVLENIQTRKIGKTSQYEVQLLKSNEESVPVIISGTPIIDEDGNHRGSFAVLTDISRIRDAEKALKQSEKKFHEVLSNAPDIIYRTDLFNQEFDYISQACIGILGYYPEEIIKLGTQGLTERVHPEDRHLLSKYRMKPDQLPQDLFGSHIIEFRIKRKDGVYVWVSDVHKVILNEEGRPRYIIGNIRDISRYRDTQDALAQTEILMSNVFSSIQDGISILDNQMRIIQVNPTMEKWYSHMMPLIGKKCYEAYHQRNVPCVVCPTIKSIRNKTAYREIVPFVGENEEILGWFELYSFPLMDQQTGKITGIIEYVRNVTDRERAEEILRAQRDLGVAIAGQFTYEKSLETILDIVVRVTGMDSGGVYTVNRDTGELILHCAKGLSSEFISSVSKFPPDTPRIGIIKKGKPLFMDYLTLTSASNPMVKREGLRSLANVPFIFEGELIGCINISSHSLTNVPEHAREALDILTPQIVGLLLRIEAEETLRKSETMYKLLSEKSLQGLLIIQNQSILFCNPAFADIIGYTQDEILNLTLEEFWKIISEQDRDEIKTNLMEDIIKSGDLKFSGMKLIRKDGAIRHVESYLTLIEIKNQRAIQMVIVDITDRIQAQLQLSTAKDRALLYLDLMAHDIRNQLQVILGAVQTAEEISDDSKVSRILKIAEEGANRCSQIISKVKSSEQLENQPLDYARIDTILLEVIDSFKHQYPDIQIRMDISPSEAWANIDQFFKLVISDILENAVTHNPHQTSQKKIWIRTYPQQDGLEISISDNGKGIPDSQKEALFDMQRRYGGVSLHLALQVFDKYGGNISVRDRLPGEPDLGTEFLLWIPAEIK